MKIDSVHGFNEEIYEYIGKASSPLIYTLVGISFPDSRYEIRDRHFPAYSFEYIYEGQGAIQQDGKIQKVSAGDFFVIHPGDVHYFASPKNPWKKIWFHVSGGLNYIQSLMNIFKIQNEFLYFPSLRSPLELENILEIAKNSSSDISKQLVRHTFFLLQEINDILSKSSHDLSVAARAKFYIDKHIGARLTINDIAKQISVSPDYLCRTFKSANGITPSEYIMNEKIEQSKIFLTQTDLSISKIAEHFCFFDNKHYGKAFSAHVGMPPSEYRKKYKK